MECSSLLCLLCSLAVLPATIGKCNGFGCKLCSSLFDPFSTKLSLHCNYFYLQMANLLALWWRHYQWLPPWPRPLDHPPQHRTVNSHSSSGYLLEWDWLWLVWECVSSGWHVQPTARTRITLALHHPIWWVYFCLFIFCLFYILSTNIRITATYMCVRRGNYSRLVMCLHWSVVVVGTRQK